MPLKIYLKHFLFLIPLLFFKSAQSQVYFTESDIIQNAYRIPFEYVEKHYKDFYGPLAFERFEKWIKKSDSTIQKLNSKRELTPGYWVVEEYKGQYRTFDLLIVNPTNLLVMNQGNYIRARLSNKSGIAIPDAIIKWKDELFQWNVEDSLYELNSEHLPPQIFLEVEWSKTKTGFVVNSTKSDLYSENSWRGKFYSLDHIIYNKNNHGYMACDRPKYKPGDTLRVKAFAVKKNGKELTKPMEFWINESGYYSGALKFLSRKSNEPKLPGVYTLEFPLTDSLSLDKPYSVSLKKNKKSTTLLSCTFYLEEYELDKSTFTARNEKSEYIQKESPVIHLQAKTITGHPLPGTFYQLWVGNNYSYISESASPWLVIPDTLYKTEGRTDQEGNAKITLPIDSLPNAGMSVKAKIDFTSPTGEKTTQSLSFSINKKEKGFESEIKNDSLFIRPIGALPDDSVTIECIFPDYSNQKKSVAIPWEEKIDPRFQSYNVISASGRDYEYVPTLPVEMEGGRKENYLWAKIENPWALELRWFLELENEIIETGIISDTLMKFSWAANSDKTYRLRISCFWTGDDRGEHIILEELDKLLTVSIDQPEKIVPGAKSLITISVNDDQGKPVPFVNLTAASINKEFKSSNAPVLSYPGDSYTSWDDMRRFSTSKTANGENKRWLTERLQKIHLDTIAKNNFWYPFEKTEMWITEFPGIKAQFTPHLMIEGDRLPVDAIWLDNTLVFINTDASIDCAGIFAEPGNHSVKVLSGNDTYEWNNFILENGKKIDFSIAVNHPPADLKIVLDDTHTIYELERELEAHWCKIVKSEIVGGVTVCSKNQCIPITSMSKWMGPFNFGDSLRIAGMEMDFKTTFDPLLEYKITRNGIFTQELTAAFSRNIAFRRTPLPAGLVHLEETNKTDFHYRIQDIHARPSNTLCKIRYSGKENFVFILFKSDSLREWKVEKFDKSNNPDYFYHSGQILFINEKGECFDGGKIAPYKKYLNIYSFADSLLKHISPPGDLTDAGFRTIARDTIPAPGFTDKIGFTYLPQTLYALNRSWLYFYCDGKLAGVTESDSRGFFRIPELKKGKYNILEFNCREVNQRENLFWNPDSSNAMHIHYGMDRMDPEKDYFPGHPYAQYHFYTQRIEGKTSQRLFEYNRFRLPGPFFFLRLFPRHFKFSPGEHGVRDPNAASFKRGRGDYAGYQYASDENPAYRDPNITIRGGRSDSTRYYIEGFNAPMSVAVHGVVIDQSSANPVPFATVLLYEIDAEGELIPLEGGFMRSEFSDVAYWQPLLITDSSGKASFEITFPENITTWNNWVAAMNGKRQVGFISSETKATKPLVATLDVPRFLIEGDSASAIGLAQNFTEDSIRFISTFSSGEKEIIHSPTLLKSLEKQDFDFIANEDTIEISYSVESEDRLRDGEKKTIPVLPAGVLETDGKFFILQNDTSFTMDLSDLKGNLKVSVQNNELPTLISAAEDLENYPHFCVEQTASKIIGLLCLDELHDSLGIGKNEKSKIRKMIRRLEGMASPQYLYGWWNNNKHDNFMTGYAAYALTLAKAHGFEPKHLEDSKNYLSRHYEDDAENCETNLLKVRSGIDLPISYWNIHTPAWQDTCSFSDYVIDALIRKLSDKPIQLQRLLENQRRTVFCGIYFSDTSKNLLSSEINLTLMAFELLKDDAQYADICKKIRLFIMESHPGGTPWNTIETAQALRCLIPVLKKEKLNTIPEINITQDTMKKKIKGGASTFTLNSNAPIKIEKSGQGPAYISVYSRQWNKNPNKIDSLYNVRSFFAQEGKVSNDSSLAGGFSPLGDQGVRVEREESLSPLYPAELIVKVEVKAKTPWALVEVPIPAGCSYGEKIQPGGIENHREYFKDRVAIYCKSLPVGTHTFRIPLEPRYNGKYTLNPVRVESMYFPVFYGRNKLRQLRIGTF